MKIVMAFGTFDIFHPGHESYLKQARSLGDKLIVIIARDEVVKKNKGQNTVNDENVRLKKVYEIRLADIAVLGDLKDKYKILKKFRPDVIALGYDQTVSIEELKEKLKEFDLKPKIVRLIPYKPEIYKSSKLK